MFGGPLSDIPYRVSPGFSSIDAGMYVRAAALHHRSPPLSAVLPSVGGCCAVTVATASAFRSFMAMAAASYSVLLHSLFMFLSVICFMRVPA